MFGPVAPALAANDDVFTVGNYPVDAQAANAVDANPPVSPVVDSLQLAWRMRPRR